MANEYILDIRRICKSFPGVNALKDVSFKVKKGSVHAIIGENGAGKSTLMNILIGLLKANSGEIYFAGEKISFDNSAQALKAGISMIHQELTPVPYLTIAENVFLGREPIIRFIRCINSKKMNNDTQNLLATLGIKIKPTVKMNSLSIANIQLVEIAKAISYDAPLIIMDEPTSAITDNEVEKLFAIIRKLKEDGVTVLYISHKMKEVLDISDEITVLRDGEVIDTVKTSEVNEKQLIQLMVGRAIENVFPKINVNIGKTVLEVKNLCRKGVFENISFSVRRGEILGIAGLMGAGRSEVMRCIFGIDKLDQGEIYINNRKVVINSPMDAIKNNIAFLTEDRKLDGLFLPHSVMNNMVVSSINNYKGRFKFRTSKMRKDCTEQIEQLSIKTPSLEQKVNNLSGGNQQKVLVSKWILTRPKILILDEPTRGIDVGSKAEIHKLIGTFAQTGKAIIMISSELPEIMGMSDRIVVMHEGRITGEIQREEAKQDRIMHYAFGFKD